MATDKDITISVKVDTKDVNESFKDIEKSSKDMSKTVTRETDKTEKEFVNLKKSITNVSKELANSFKNLNVTNLTQSLSKMKTTVANTANQIKQQLKQALDVDGKLKIDADISSGKQASNMTSNFMASATASATTSGAMLQKNLSLMGSLKKVGSDFAGAIKNSVSSFTGINKGMKETSHSMKEVASSVDNSAQSIKEMTNSMTGMEAEGRRIKEAWNEYRLIVKESGGDMDKFNKTILNSTKNLIKCANAFEQTSKRGDLSNLLRQYQLMLNMLEMGEADTTKLYKATQELKRSINGREFQGRGANNKIVSEKDIQLAKELSNELVQMVQQYKFGVKGLDSMTKEFLNRGLLDPTQVAKDISNINKLEQEFIQLKNSGGAEILAKQWREFANTMQQTTGQSIPSLQRMEQLLDKIKAKSSQSKNGKTIMSLSDIQEFLSCSAQIKKEYAEINKAQQVLGKNDALDKVSRELKEVGNSATQAKKASQAVKDIGKASQETAKKVKGLSTSLKSIIKSALPFLTLYGAFNLVKQSVSEASNSIETASKFTNVLGSDAQELESWINGLNSKFGTGTTNMKNYTATMYAMTRNMTGSREQAKQMTKDLVMLSQDMASFYDMSADDAFAKLRSYMAGSSEVLYDFGVIATEANLQQFALAQGINKSWSEMSQAEKATIRYQFAMQGLSDASGDLGITMSSPANRARQLSNALYELRVALGGVVLPIWNAVMPGLIALANALTAVFNKIASVVNGILSLFKLGLKGGSSGGGGIFGGMANDSENFADSLGGVSDSLDRGGSGASDIADNLGKGAENAQKITKSLMGLDEINNLSSPDSSSGSGSGGSGSGGSGGSGGGGLGSGLGGLGLNDKVANEFEVVGDDIPEWLQKIADIFKNAFNQTFNFDMFKDFLNNCNRVKQAISDIFNDSKLQIVMENLKTQMIAELGSWIGTLGTLMFSVGNAIAGGLANSLEKNKQYIIDKLIGIFQIDKEASIISQRLSIALSEIFSTLGGEEAQRIVENIFDTLTVGLLEGMELFHKMGRDALLIFAQGIIDNKDKIIEALTNTLSVVGQITGTISTFFQDAFKKVNEVYDEHIKPFIDSFSQGLSNLWGTLLDGYNTYFKPAMDSIAQKFEEVMNGSVGECVSNFLDLIGDIFDCLTELWNQYLQPILDWVIGVLAPLFAGAWDIICTAVLNAIDVIAQVIDGIIDIFRGIIQFLTGIFTGDWQKAWDGLCLIFEGFKKIILAIWDNLVNNTREIVDKLKGWLLKAWEAIKENTVKLVKKLWSEIVDRWKKLGSDISTLLQNISSTCKTKWEEIKQKVIDKVKEMWSKVTEWFGKIKDNVVTWCSDLLTNIKDGWKKIVDGIKDKCTEIWDNITGWFKDIVGLFTGGWKDSDKETEKGFDNIEETAKNGADKTKTGIMSKLKGVLPDLGTLWSNVKSGASDKWSSIKETVTTWSTKAKDGIKNSLSGVTGNLSTIWSNVKNGASTAWSNIKGGVSDWATKTKNGVQSSLSGAVGNVATIWSNIKGGVSGAWSNVKNAVSGSVSAVKNQVQSSLSGAISNVSNIWSSISRGVSGAWNGIRSQVQAAVNKVKSVMNFSWSLPKPKLPHFKVSGGQAPWGFGGQGKLPSISVQFYKNGGILTKPTFFGMNGNSAMIGGEAGKEGVIPLDRLWAELDKQFSRQNAMLGNAISKSSQDVNITLEMDGKKIAKGVYKHQRTMTQLGQINWDFL